MARKELEKLYSIVTSLKNTDRQGWTVRGLRREPISSHIFGAQSIWFYLATEEGVNADRVIQLLLVHDYIMSQIEDVTPLGDKYQQKRLMEENAKNAVAQKVPVKLRHTYTDLFNEFNAVETPEAQVAREADKLDTLMQAEVLEIESNHYDFLGAFLDTYESIFKTPSGKKAFKEIMERHKLRANKTYKF